MKSSFDEAYFERGIETGVSCYSNYRWIPELTIPLAHQLVTQLCISPSWDTVLDYGCAKGYLVKALRLLQYQAFGVDISQYALSTVPIDTRPYVKALGDDGSIPMPWTPSGSLNRYTWTIAKDVLEHVTYGQLDAVLQRIRHVTKRLLVVVPLGRDGKYVVPAYENDVTHVIREDLGWWCDRLLATGYRIISARHLMPHVKGNWAQWKEGNGFITAT